MKSGTEARDRIFTEQNSLFELRPGDAVPGSSDVHLQSYVEAGGLMSYGVDTEPLFRRGAAFVAKILRGGKASDFPVEQASNFELTVNLKTKAAGYTADLSGSGLLLCNSTQNRFSPVARPGCAFTACVPA